MAAAIGSIHGTAQQSIYITAQEGYDKYSLHFNANEAINSCGQKNHTGCKKILGITISGDPKNLTSNNISRILSAANGAFLTVRNLSHTLAKPEHERFSLDTEKESHKIYLGYFEKAKKETGLTAVSNPKLDI